VEKTLAAQATQQQAQPFDTDTLAVPDPTNQVTLGTALTGSHYTLQEDDLTQHLLAVGQSGAGKTTLFYNLIDQLTAPFWSFDVKQDYRHLIHDRDDLLVLPWKELKFNPLKPPQDVPPRRWAQVFAELFGHATALLSGSKNYLMQAIIQLYQLYDLFQEVAPPYPSLHELQLLAERENINYMRTSSDYRDRILNRVEAMNLTAGTVFDCSEGYPVEDLLQRNVVFEFDGLGTDLQNFLMEILFAYVYEYRVAQNQRGGDLRHVFFLDEGKRVFSVYKERQDASGIPAIDELTAKMREFGEGLVVADQEASKLTDSIKANTYTKVLLATGDAKQFREITGSMHLTERQEELAAELGIGEAIVQTGNRDPVPVSLDAYDVAKSVTDDDLNEWQTEAWETLESEPREVTTAFEEAIGEGEVVVQDLELSDAAETLLADVVENEFMPLTTRYELFADREEGVAAKDELVSAGLVAERTVKGIQAGKRVLLELTEAGREYVDEETELEVEQEGRGGVVHRFWQHQIKAVIEEAGWSASLEASDADVWTVMDGTELVVEVAMGDSEREVDHVDKHLEQGFDTIWIACPTQEIENGLETRLADHGVRDAVVFKRLAEFLNPEQAADSVASTAE
jgi:hypothetical protein